MEHGAPLRLLVPVKLGLKNVKAITGTGPMSRKSQETTGQNVDIPDMTDSSA